MTYRFHYNFTFSFITYLCLLQVAEAALFVMAAVARMILPSENDVVPQVLESVLSMPPTTHVAVRHVGLRLVGELAEWMDQQPQYLDRVLNWLLAGLQVCNKKFLSRTQFMPLWALGNQIYDVHKFFGFFAHGNL